MEPILAGIETEYGLYVEGRGAENQVDDSMALVRAFPGKRFVGWDYRYESPRADLRGFRLDRLAFDPQDARYDSNRPPTSDQDIRSDRILTNGARFYNDHGHPEYSTPECFSLEELVRHDLAGEFVLRSAAEAYSEETGHVVRLYKNNTDFHGASYGTHESYLVPRQFGFEELYRAIVPILVARQLLCGAGKVGAEAGEKCEFQLSQRADFMVEPASAETLYRRSLFNTRDEPHADPARWLRLHVIAGDANMIPSATRRKVGLVKLSLALLMADAVPHWQIPHPVAAFASVSKDPGHEFRVELGKGSWTNAFEILESYFAAAESTFGLRSGLEAEGMLGELQQVIEESRMLLPSLRDCPERLREKVDWAAKKWMLEQVAEGEGWDWTNPALRSYDLEYHNLDRADGLYFALADEGEVEGRPDDVELEPYARSASEGTRAWARGIAVEQFGQSLRTAGWRSLTFEVDGKTEEVELSPHLTYPMELKEAESVVSFIQVLRSLS